MSDWRSNEEVPVDFLDVLYGKEEEVEYEDDEIEQEEGEEYDEVDDGEDEYEVLVSHHLPRSPAEREILPTREDERWSPPEAGYSPLTSWDRVIRVSQRDEGVLHRSASPDRSRSPIGFPAPDVVLRIYDEHGVALDDGLQEFEFVDPDAHLWFLPPEGSTPRDTLTSGLRGRLRGGIGRGVRRSRTQARRQWRVGHPLTEIWTTDDDVPTALIDMANEVIRRRNERSRETQHASESENEDDVFFDANDGADTVPRLETHFEWAPMESFQGQEETFRPKRTGSVKVCNSAYDAFRSYWGDDILSSIVEETNRYATKISSPSFQSKWYPTNLDEILCLFAFWMMLGIVRMPTIVSCFSVDPLLKTEVFRRILTRSRYEMLTRALHFVNSDPAMNNANPSINGAARSLDRLHLIRPIITHLNSKFQDNYVLSKNICIDESLTLWKGRLDIKQYIRSKASKFGIKTFELCESVTGYLWSFIVYTGKQSGTDLGQSPGELKGTAVVKKLIAPLLNKGYRLFMDNWYNSPLLARYLKLNGTDCVGTLRPSCRDVPVLINKAPLNKGQLIARHSGDVSILSWQDKKRVTMISTCHGSSTALPTVASRPTLRPVPFKPQVVLDYNKFMGGVDSKDQMLEPYLLERKRCAKWYMKLFKRLINVSILNSRILVQSSTQKHQDHLSFRLQLVDSILTKHLSACPQGRRRFNASSSRGAHEQPDRFVNSKHWPILLEPTERSAANHRKFWKRCNVCLREGRKSQKTAYCCEACRVPLCITNCFKTYHTS